MDRLTGLAVFVEIAECGSSAAAARRLALSGSAVSKHLARLAQRRGARLFHRTTRRVSLTEAGAAFRERVVRLLAELAEAEVAGLGIVVMATFMAAAELADGRLLPVLPVLPDWRPPDAPLAGVYPPSRQVSRKVRIFIDFLARRFGPEPYWDRGLAGLPGRSAAE